jgi:hypothetical protein
VPDNVPRRSQRWQNIDESEHLRLEDRVSHRPFHQASIEIFASEEAGSALVFVDEGEDFPAQLLDFQLNRPNITHEVRLKLTKATLLAKQKIDKFRNQEFRSSGVAMQVFRTLGARRAFVRCRA